MTESTLEKAEAAVIQDRPKCPRCHTGQMLFRNEVEGLELKCIHCGHSITKRALLAARQRGVKAA